VTGSSLNISREDDPGSLARQVVAQKSIHSWMEAADWQPHPQSRSRSNQQKEAEYSKRLEDWTKRADQPPRFSIAILGNSVHKYISPTLV